MARISYTHTQDGFVQHGLFDSSTAEVFYGNDPDPDLDVMSEELYFTSDGDWILNRVTGGASASTYETITTDQAREWLNDNYYPEAATTYCRTGPGRPRKGSKVEVRIPQSDLTYIEYLAAMANEDRTEVIRVLLEGAIAQHRVLSSSILTEKLDRLSDH